MSEAISEPEVAVEPTRNELRARLLAAQKPKSKTITLFGQRIELRQPTFEAVIESQDEDSTSLQKAIRLIVRFAYVPGTNERIFEDADYAVMKEWPFGSDVIAVQSAISDLTGLDVEDAEVMLKDPLSGS